MEKDQYFGVPLDNILAAQAHSIHSRSSRQCINVPSRTEVASLPPGQVREAIVEWLSRPAIEIIPSKTQIQEVLDVLYTRPDHDAVGDVMVLCEHYIQGIRIPAMN
ncbi:hypothetical protein J2X56_001137 [Herbaspirillum sp. 1173]|uniref:hypothetical protein n=1 Tax=Herbaspirillum sp. 1173 TaxID=2817734 RepID=UPI002865E7E4|nr:hypothetical protein [Herbaspirillum sp. 1173]MDR6739151.1 hypothetical protein [Herbaspirillum sp. 1173]